MFAQPLVRPNFIGHEVEDRTVISFATKTATGFYGKFEELPADPTQPATCFSSEPFTVNLTDADLQAIASIVLTRAAEQGLAGMDANSAVRID